MKIDEAIEVLEANYPTPNYTELCKAVDLAISSLKKQRDNKWILCSERLPENKCDVLIQFGWNMAVGYIDCGDWRINSGNGYCTDVIEDDGTPVAWMPLPSSYEGVR